jgi:hypothetical protein
VVAVLVAAGLIMNLNFPVYRRGNTLVLHVRIGGRQIKRSLRTLDPNLAKVRATELLGSLMAGELQTKLPAVPAWSIPEHQLDFETVQQDSLTLDHALARAPRVSPISKLTNYEFNSTLSLTQRQITTLPDPEKYLLHTIFAEYGQIKKLRLVTKNDYASYAKEMVEFWGNRDIRVDGCQLLGLGQDWKYERQGLVSLKRIVEALRELQLPAKDLLSFQRWVMFNYLIGNSDAHAKNISVLIGETGYALAPFYDLLCVRVYGDDRLALYVGDEDQYASIGAHSWEAFCGDCGFSVKPTLTLFRKMAQDVTKAWATVTAQVTADYALSQQELALIQSITKVIENHCSACLLYTSDAADDVGGV